MGLSPAGSNVVPMSNNHHTNTHHTHTSTTTSTATSADTATMTPHPVTWFEIAVTDLERAKGFYEAVFALTLTNMPTPEGEDYWTFPMDDSRVGAGGALTTMEGMKPGRGGTLI